MKKGKVEEIRMEKIANGFSVTVNFHDLKSKDKWDMITETYAFTQLDLALDKVVELSQHI